MDTVLVQHIHNHPNVPITLRARSKGDSFLLFIKTRYCPHQQIVPTTHSYVTMDVPDHASSSVNILTEFVNQAKINCHSPRASTTQLGEIVDPAAELETVSASLSRLVPTMTSATYSYKINIVMTGMVCPEVWGRFLHLPENLFLHDLCKIFGCLKHFKYKAYTDSPKVHAKSIITKMFMFGENTYANYSLLHFAPTLEFKHIDIQNKDCVVVNFDFGFYCNDFICIQQLLFKLFYKYGFTLFSCMEENDDDGEQMPAIETQLHDYFQYQRAIISQELIFSPPTRLLKQGGIRHQQARDNYYVSEGHIQPIIVSNESTKSIRIPRRNSLWNKFKHFIN